MSQEAFRVQGNASLSGEITPQGAKNEALQIISAVLLTSEPVRIKNLPDILDIQKQISLVKGCLLYTSPSPRDRTRSRMPSSA